MIRPFHPLADIFPLIEGDEFEHLVASVKASNGPRDPIILHDGMILDGRNRARACEAAGVEPRYAPLPVGVDPVEFVIDKNLRRRHLNESQRGMAAAKLANMPAHRVSDEEKCLNSSTSQDQAADLLNVSRFTVQAAAKVHQKAEPALVAAVEQGHIAVSAAAQAVGLPAEQQREIADQAKAGRKNVVRTTIKKARREKREQDLGKKQRDLPQKKYGVIYADPEWRFEPYSRETGMDRSPDNHYPTTATADIILRPVATISDKNAVCFLWATAPMLPQALRVLKEWGFEYKTHMIWHKTRNGNGRGSGYWFTGEHELLLVGTRGAVPAPATTFGPSIVQAPWQGRHSAKPELFAEMIEQLFPTMTKIELNRRGPPREGWDAWGLESEAPVSIPADQCEHLSEMHFLADEIHEEVELPEGLLKSVSHETPAESEAEAEGDTMSRGHAVADTSPATAPEPASVTSCVVDAGSPVETPKCAICGGSCKPTFCPNDPAPEIPKFLRRATEGKTAAA